MTNKTPKLAVITGPTATGKTALGVLLAKELNGEIVSADSMQVYRRMNIGTAKVTTEEMQGVPHHMLDVCDPSESYNVARYVKEADACVQDILSRGKLPIIVGGTGLYIDSLVAGRDFDDFSSDKALRLELDARYEAMGGEKMLSELSAFDLERAKKLFPSDKNRILRALEVYYVTGRTITEHDEETQKVPKRYDASVIALSFEDRADLYKRIDTRVDLMAQAGLFDEVHAILKSGVPEKCTAMQAIGYKEAAMALRGEISQAQAIEIIKRESRRYAKRQLTWLRRKDDIDWILWKTAPDFECGRQISTKYFAQTE
ncbi:MAG: tRNA (adenosine(37)-N6)-dimethylallyltransferase MiaA [Oscillospiraceae bacterium]|nr:tRNA (adenosine(37)-N6)-dimethylallyltransferase MiaA [Oscillospiraceae bacterium]